MKKFLLFLLIVALAGGGWWWVKRAKAAEPVYKRYTVASGDLVLSVQATGNVEPLNRLEARPPVAGRVEEMVVREGDYVKRGQVMAWLSSTERAAMLDAARAQGPEALARWEQLYKATPLVAPISGQVIARVTEPGQTVGASDTIVVLSDHLIVKAQVDETDIAKIHSGMDAEIRLDAYSDQVIKAKVGHIAYEAVTVNNVTMYNVDVAALRIPAFMRSGMSATINFITDRHADTLLLPMDAIRHRRGEHGIVLVPADPNAKGTPQPLTRSVQLGLDNGEQVEVLSGLKEDDVVLATSQALPSAAGQGSNPFMPQRPSRGARKAAR